MFCISDHFAGVSKTVRLMLMDNPKPNHMDTASCCCVDPAKSGPMVARDCSRQHFGNSDDRVFPILNYLE